MPQYSALRDGRGTKLPADLSEQETSPTFRARRDEIEAWLCEASRVPRPEDPLFVEIIAGDQQSLLTLLPEDDKPPCLLIFSSPFRAADYVRTILHSGPVQYLSSSPLELVALLRDVREVGIHQFTIDRCPRCNIYCAIHNESVISADKAIQCWSIYKAAELARMELYLSHAQASAKGGALANARDVLLETAAHVSLEDPRVHALLGEVAVALHDAELLREAKAFLQYFQFDLWKSRLDDIVLLGSPTFEM